MQLVVIAAFAILLCMPASGWGAGWVRSPGLTVLLVAAVAAVPPLIAAVGSLFVWRRAGRLNARDSAHRIYGAASAAVRLSLLGGLVVSFWGTSWVRLVRGSWGLGRVALLNELVLLGPFVAGLLLSWVAGYPAERALRVQGAERRSWGLGHYLTFNVRYHLLLVGVPMTAILLVKDLAERYRLALMRLSGAPWAAEACLVGTAGLMFLIAPVLTRWIWAARTLPPGQLRARLEELCRRIKLRYRDILLWETGRMVVNAAVMGLVRPVRYLLLSDGLLEALDERQVEAVFGHEAGHVKHHHLVFYVLFAAASTLVAGGVIELCDRVLHYRIENPEALGLGLLALMWLPGFGWVSRRFERQADLFGVRCLAEVLAEGGQDSRSAELAAADSYAETLEHIAILNGISPQSRSWRHSSVASRMEFVRQCNLDGAMERRFSRNLLVVKGLLVAVVVVGMGIGASLYWPRAWRFWG